MQAWTSNHTPSEVLQDIINRQTSTAAPLKFGDGYIIPSHTLLRIWLLIRAVIEIKPC